MQRRRARWFSPLVSGRLSLRDRAWVPAMVPWRATEDGVVTDDGLEALHFGYRERVTDVDAPHIRDLPRVLPEVFAAAARAEQAGFDGVELHYAHAYTRRASSPPSTIGRMGTAESALGACSFRWRCSATSSRAWP